MSYNTVNAACPDRCCANKASAISASFVIPAPAAHKTSRQQFAPRSDAVKAVAPPSEVQNLNLNGAESIEAQLRRLDGRPMRTNKSIAPLIADQAHAEEPKGFWATVKAAFTSPTVLHGISGGDIYVRD